MFCQSDNSTRYPLFLKIDLSPLCNIHCTACIHAGKVGDGGLLDKQYFYSQQRMSLDDYKRIIDEVRGKTTSIVLHYLGEPYMYSEIDEAARYAYNAGIRVHIGSNFSFLFTDERIDSILHSGVTDLTVCVDGLTQEVYEKTRVGGKIDKVLHNLERLCKRRKELNIKHLHIEVQYIRFEHNKHEENSIRNKVFQFGVDQFSSFNGNTGNWVNKDPSCGFYKHREAKPKRSLGFFPYCYRPYRYMTIRYDGEVIPCCDYRIGEQYAQGITPISLGNVFQESVKRVWNSQSYKIMRKYVFDPSRKPSASFCVGCPHLFNVDRQETYGLNRVDGGLTTLKNDSSQISNSVRKIG